MEFDLKKEFNTTLSGLAELKKSEVLIPVGISTVLAIVLLPGFLLTVGGDGGDFISWIDVLPEKKLFDKDTEPVESCAWGVHLLLWSLITVALFWYFAKGDKNQIKENLRIALGFIVIGIVFTIALQQADINHKEDADGCVWLNIIAALLFTVGYVMVDKNFLKEYFDKESNKMMSSPVSPTNSYASVPLATLM